MSFDKVPLVFTVSPFSSIADADADVVTLFHDLSMTANSRKTVLSLYE